MRGRIGDCLDAAESDLAVASRGPDVQQRHRWFRAFAQFDRFVPVRTRFIPDERSISGLCPQGSSALPQGLHCTARRTCVHAPGVLAASKVGKHQCIASRLPVELPDSYPLRSEEHTSELQSLMRTSFAVFCLKKKTT